MANFGGLAKNLKCDLSDLRDFALGFTQAKASFDFIDVGYGKDGAATKIKGRTQNVDDIFSSMKLC